MYKIISTQLVYLFLLLALIANYGTKAQTITRFADSSAIYVTNVHSPGGSFSGYNTSDYVERIVFDSMRCRISCTSPSQEYNIGSATGYYFNFIDNAQIPLNTIYSSFGGTTEFQEQVGPGNSRSYTLSFSEYGSGCTGPGTNSGHTTTLAAVTDAIHAPYNVSSGSVSIGGFNHVKLFWYPGTDIPSGPLVKYIIYRNNVAISDTLSSTTALSFVDSANLLTGTYTYAVTTYTPGASYAVPHFLVSSVGTDNTSWGPQESNKSSISVNLNNDLLTASDGTYYGRTQLAWPNLSSIAPNDISILRNNVQIGVVNKNSTQYGDYTTIPGVVYRYTLAPIDANNQTPLTFSDSGSSRPNGVIKGTISSLFNAPITGATVVASSVIHGTTHTYTTTTDASGFYQFSDVFYYDSAIYTITPSRGSQRFRPAMLNRTLDLNTNNASNVDFVDTSVFTITGTVRFGASPYCSCMSSGVPIHVNGAGANSTTASNGAFTLTIQQQGRYVIAPVLKDHKFHPDSMVINVAGDTFGLSFIDSTYDNLSISLKGGCHNSIADQAIVVVTDANNLYVNKTVTFNATRDTTLIVPAQAYNVNFSQANTGGVINPAISFNNPLITVDLSTRDSTTSRRTDTVITYTPVSYDTLLNHSIDTITAHYDTIIHNDSSVIRIWNRADFVFHSGIAVTVPDSAFWHLTPGCNFNNGFIMGQLTPQYVRVHIDETYTYSAITCPVDSGVVIVHDDVSGIGSPQSFNFHHGIFGYTVNPNEPNIAAPYEKLLQFNAHVGNLNVAWGREIIVLGVKASTATYVTKTPELPLYVLHDPPGDASYSFLAKDSTVTTSFTNSYQVGGSGNAYTELKEAVELPVALTGIVTGFGVAMQEDITAGGNYNNSGTYTASFTASQQFSTSGSTDFVGSGGDVFVGASFNMIYSMSDIIDLSGCGVAHTRDIAMSPTGIATNYMYTESHIEQTLIPQLQAIYSILTGPHATQAQRDTGKLYKSYIDAWNNVLSVNRKNRDTLAIFKRNVSFSAGVPYDNSISTSTDTSTSVGYDMFIDRNVGLQLFGGDLAGFDVSTIGVKVNFHWNMNQNTTTDVTQTLTTGYHLEDSNPGDFFSVDVKADRIYGTPSFAMVAGTSSCPHEDGTQARDAVQLALNTYEISDVPLNTAATFTAHIINLSESQEIRTYSIQAVPESNPFGAIIKIGGQQINNSPANFTVAWGQDLPVLMTVEAGPTVANYDSLKVSAFSPCDGGEGNTVTFNADFQSRCSPIGIYSPANNWLVNGTSDTLPVIFSGYNLNDTNLLSISLEYHRAGGVWTNVVTRSRAYLLANQGAQYYTYRFNTDSLPEGSYEIRAKATCGAGAGQVNYSQVLSGIIDRSALRLFGTPSPADGVLNVTQDISISFNGAIDCNQGATHHSAIIATLTTASGQVIPDSVTCNGNQLIIYTNPPSLLDNYENQMITATVNNVYDLNGNALQQPVSWSFLVSRSKVYWSPPNMNVNTITGTTVSTSATMLNIGPAATFTITHSQPWLTTPQVVSYPISGGTPASPATLVIPFTVQNSLDQGHYVDTVVAMVNGKRVYLFVYVDVVKTHPHWHVNPADYQYSMNVTTNYSLTQLNAPLSADTRDTIAVFVGEECRGYAGISYDSYSNSYVAFLTAYSNNAVGDTFKFRIWDAIPGTEYQAKERLPFINDGLIGQPLVPYILHPEGIFQTLAFGTGWNWFSLNVVAADMTPKNVLSQLHPVNGGTVKTLNEYCQYNSASGLWQGTLSAFGVNKSYQIQLSRPDTIHLLGLAVTDTTVISVAQGWNWIGYPRQNISTAASYLANTNPTAGDLLKTQSQFTQYNSGSWSGGLNVMNPGQGYRLKSANAFNFVVAPERSLPSWSVNEHQYQQNQSITADLQFNGNTVTQSHFLVGAFANGVCIGVGQPLFIPSLNTYRIFLTVHGDTANVGSAITFKVYDTDNDAEYIPAFDPISIVPDSAIAKVETPYVINVVWATGINAVNVTEGYGLLQNVPNPFSKNTNIEYVIPAVQEVNITLYDESGRRIAELVSSSQAAGRHQVSFVQEDLQSGVYFYQMKSGEFSRTRRMLIIK